MFSKTTRFTLRSYNLILANSAVLITAFGANGSSVTK